MATVNFLYRSKKAKAPLNLRLLFRYQNKDYVLGGKSKLVVSNYYWTKIHKSNPRDIKLKNEQTEVLKELNNIESFLVNAYNGHHDKSILDKNWIKQQLNFYYNINDKENAIPKDLVSFIDYFIEERKHEVKPASIKKFKVIKNKMIRFENYLGKTILLNKINNDFKIEFAEYYRSENYSVNTAQRELVFIKTFCKYAKRKGLEVNPETEYLKLPKEEVPKVYLNFQELRQIEDAKLEHDYLINARDWLIISCYTGQRVSDFMRFNKSMIREESSKLLLEFKQVKTGKLMTIPLLPKVIEILEKRKGDFPRRISDQKYNDYIKIVGREAKLFDIINGKMQINIADDDNEKSKMRNVYGSYEKYKLISSHIGRRSFASNYYGKIPTTFLIYITGHSTENMFLNYIGKSNKDMALEMANMFDKIG
ncbi:phage integrase family protein [Winogradskyella pacifica]|uniref:Phage integrase family protein n=1 Tax=Winogradskyella pacifica TaxID=664642 RepID=A0A3D9MZC5_9FLAO|nr:phage integrase SAM-like domain-containing protein [Winogradskyella pacifica]REE24707.1 phage integrase family protein [Winogradskyella pacifica]